MSLEKMFKGKQLVKITTEDAIDQPLLNVGDRYQLTTWNAIHFIVGVDSTHFKLEETLGAKLNIGEQYALITNEKQEPHIPTKRTVIKMNGEDEKKFRQLFFEQAKQIAVKNGHA